MERKSREFIDWKHMTDEDLQKVLDAMCEVCFRHRPEYLQGIEQGAPYSLQRAREIAERMEAHQAQDEKAVELGDIILRNWQYFGRLVR